MPSIYCAFPAIRQSNRKHLKNEIWIVLSNYLSPAAESQVYGGMIDKIPFESN